MLGQYGPIGAQGECGGYVNPAGSSCPDLRNLRSVPFDALDFRLIDSMDGPSKHVINEQVVFIACTLTRG